jgi:hypothetical protein
MTAPLNLGRFVGWTLTDHDAPAESSVVTRVVDDVDQVVFHTRAGWSFGGKREYLEVSDRGDRVIVSITPFLQATLERPEASA